MKAIWKIILGLAFATILVLAFVIIHGRPCGKDFHHYRKSNVINDSCRIEVMVNEMAKELSLTDAQKQKILQISFSHSSDMNTIESKYKDDCVGAHEAHMQMMKNKQDEIRAVLNDDQRKKFDEFQNKMRDFHHEERGEHWHHPREGNHK
jgi:hypothetical protein